MPQLPWTEDMVTTLLNIVILKKAHLSGGCKGVKEIWNDVNSREESVPFGAKSLSYK